MKRSLIVTLLLICCNMHSHNTQNHQENINLKNNIEQVDTTTNQNEHENDSNITKAEKEFIIKKRLELLQKQLELHKIEHEIARLQLCAFVVSALLFGNIMAIINFYRNL